jgi:hypothetical protein
VVRGTILAIITIAVYGHHNSMMTHASDPLHQSPHFHPDADIYAYGVIVVVGVKGSVVRGSLTIVAIPLCNH